MRGQPFFSRKAIAGLICLISLLNDTLVQPTILAAQDIVFSFPEGHARLRRASNWQFPNAEDAIVSMVRDEIIKEELELSESQSKELIQAIFEESEKIRLRSLSNAEDPATARSERDDRDEHEPLRKRIRDILLPHQVETLDSIYCWSVFRSLGNPALAKHVADQSGVILTADQEQAIKEVAKRLDEEFLDFAMNEYLALLEATGERFPYFRDHLAAFAHSSSPLSVDVLFADFQAIDELLKDGFPDTLTALVRADRSGQIHPFRNLTVESVPKGNSAWFEFVRLLRVPDVESGGLLSPDQRNAIDILEASASDEFRMIAIEYANQSKANPREASRKMLDAKARLDQKSMKYLENEILLPYQVKWLVDALRQRLIRSYGLLGILWITAGPDGEEISSSDKDKIRNFLKSEIAMLKDKVTREFQRNVGQQVDELPESVRSEVRQRLGEPPDYLVPFLSILDQRVKGASGKVPGSTR